MKATSITKSELKERFPWLGTQQPVAGADVVDELNQLYKSMRRPVESKRVRDVESLEAVEARMLGLTVDELRLKRAGRLNLSLRELAARQVIADTWAVRLAGEIAILEPSQLHDENLREAQAELRRSIKALKAGRE